MTKIDLSLDLPDRVAREARESGLLLPTAVARMLRKEIRRQAAARLVAGAKAADSMPLAMAELQHEIAIVRKNVGRSPGEAPATPGA